jgi:hypothetical protein
MTILSRCKQALNKYHITKITLFINLEMLKIIPIKIILISSYCFILMQLTFLYKNYK